MVIQNVLSEAIKQGEVDHVDLLVAMAAAKRAEWEVSLMSDWAHRQGAKPSAITLPGLLALLG
jgi:hypothetical protein